MPNCGPACVFCGRCGKDFSFLEGVKPVNVAPPGVAADTRAEKVTIAPVEQRPAALRETEDRKGAMTPAPDEESEGSGS